MCRTVPCLLRTLPAAQHYNPPHFVLVILSERAEVELQGFGTGDLCLDELVLVLTYKAV